MRNTLILAALMVLLMTPSAARAAYNSNNGVVLEKVSLRAGPDNNAPRLVTLRANTGLRVLGCLSGWNWCEVETAGLHGWIHSGAIGVRYHGHVRSARSYAPRLGLPVIVFNERLYWSKYYNDRDFYTSRYGRHHNSHHDQDQGNRHSNDRSDGWKYVRECHDTRYGRECRMVARRDNDDRNDRNDDNWRRDHDDDDDRNDDHTYNR
ncbi:MAG: SH3 domain-containing protein [Alphaproteobacteria bacterium]